MRGNIKVMLAGAGDISVEYDKVLKKLDIDFFTITRGTEKAQLYEEKSGTKPITGGLQKYFSDNKNEIPTHAILAVGVEALFENCMLLIEKGVQHILMEKPGGKSIEEIEQIAEAAKSKGTKIFLAYNRRFYASVTLARQIIEKDNGVEAFHFEFTELGHKITSLKKTAEVKEAWFLANSTHVADLAFFLGGRPSVMYSFTAGGNAWHPSATIFAGAGKSETGALFTYKAHWDAPGRWGVEVLTRKHRLILQPLEQLFIQKIGSFQAEQMPIENLHEIDYKPGFYNQVRCWLNGEEENLCSIRYQVDMMRWYKQMANY